MSDGRIITGDELKEDATLECDVCVIGSGSGGAWLAHELTARGKRVVMLEEGGYHTRREFDMIESRAYTTLYQENAGRTTDDASITVLQGRSVGGSTTANWCSSFRTPEHILRHWKDVHGVDTLTPETLGPHWDAVEKRLHIAEWPEAAMNANNRVLWDGLGTLGYSRGLIRRNVNNCLNLGYCGTGCPVDAKQSTLVTVIPDAVEKGLTVYANVSARALDWEGRTVKAVRADVLDPLTNRPTGVHLTVKPKVVSVSGGAINSPALLLRSGLDADGRVGRRTWLHPVVVMLGEFERRIDGFSGAPQGVYSHQFSQRGAGKVGFFLEVPPIHPLLSSVVMPLFGPALADVFGKLPFVSAAIALSVDGLLPQEEGATVRLRDGGYSRHSINYNLLDVHWDAFREACKEMAKVQFAAGARRVMSLHYEPVVLHSVADLHKLDEAPWEKLRLKLATAHQMGGCAMGKDPATSVVDPRLKFHTMDNLFVVDGSVFPTAAGVNPQLTIFGLARWAAQHVAAALR